MLKNRIDTNTIDAKTINTESVTFTTTNYKYLPAVVQLDSSTEGAQYSIFLASTGLLSSAVGQKAWAFDATKSELLSFYAILPADYKEGTNIVPCVNWLTTSSTGTSHAAYLQMNYMWTNQDTAMASTATEIYLSVSTTSKTALSMYTTNFAAITGTGKEIGSEIRGCIARNATATTDSWGSDFWINSVFFVYQTDGKNSTYSNPSDK